MELNPSSPAQISETQALDALREVIDPELGCNIVDLGLVYSLEIRAEKIHVNLTLTTPGCPMHESIAWGVQSALLRLPGIEEVDVQLVWDPPWTPDRLTEAGRAQLGVYDP